MTQTKELAKTNKNGKNELPDKYQVVQSAIDTEKQNALEKFNLILDNPPKKEWVKVNKFANKSKYLPIRIVENLLRSFFGVYQVEWIGPVHIIGNSVVAECHLKVYHPVLQQWLSYAGVGAVPIELSKEAENPLDFRSLHAKALHKNIPAAKAFAINNAAKSIGRVFGADLNSQEHSQTFELYGS